MHPWQAAFNNGQSNNEWVLSLKHAFQGKKANYKAGAHMHLIEAELQPEN